MKTLKYVAMLLAAPCATAFVDYLQNSGSPFNVATLEHAALATVLVGIGILVKSPLAALAAPAAPAPTTPTTPEAK